MANSELTIVNAVSDLKFHPLVNIAQKVLILFNRCYPNQCSKSYAGNSLNILLDSFLGISKKKISLLDLSRKNTNQFFSEFLSAISSSKFLSASEITKSNYRAQFIKMLRALSIEVPNIDVSYVTVSKNSQWKRPKISKEILEYYRGWKVTGKQGGKFKALNLAWLWNHVSHDSARGIHKLAKGFCAKFEDRSMNNHVPLVNSLLEFLSDPDQDISIDVFSDPYLVTKTQDNFCRYFFEKSEEQNNCLKTSIKRWNDALPLLNKIISDSGVFSAPIRGFPYIQPTRKSGNESNVSVNKDGIEVKDKIIIEVPLQFSDDEVLEFLFKEIKARIVLVTSWAEHEVNCITKRHKDTKGLMEPKDFSLSSYHFNRKLYGRKSKNSYPKMANTSHYLALPTSYSLEPFMYLLIKEHPEITEAFLIELELFDKNGKLVGIEKTDNTTKLVGYKKRKGGRKSQQKITLTSTSQKFVQQVISITHNAREYLSSIGDDHYRLLFLSCRLGLSKPSKCSLFPVIKRESLAFNKRLKQFAIHTDLTYEVIKDLVSRLTLNKFRATCGVQVFLDTRSVKKMSEALGHTRYKPDLISHYLPETILKFFQDRWVRVFQKGIICETMKGSRHFLRASNFKSMKELDDFLTNHAIQLPPESNETDQTGNDGGEIYISAEQGVLRVLLSIEEAVQDSTQRVHPRALY